MEIRIKETGEIKSLGIVDPKSGMNWISDLVGNYGALNDGTFTRNEDDNTYEVSQDDFDWWESLTERYEAADFAIYEYKTDLSWEDAEELTQKVGSYCDCDLEYMPEAMLEALADFKAEKSEE